MSEVLVQAVTTLAERLITLAGQDDGLRDDLRALAEAILVTTERPVRQPEAASEVEPPESEEHPEPGAEMPIAVAATPALGVTTPDAVSAALPLPELTLGRSRPQEPEFRPEPLSPAPIGRFATADADLPAIEACCRLKAEGVRWAATRRRRIDEGADFRIEIAPRDREILDRGGQIGCYLWMNTPDFSVPTEPVALGDVAGWFDALADGIALIRGMLPDVESNREFVEPALDLLAEAQSALRVAIDRIGGPNDADQFRAYDWLRGVAAREQIYIRRYMRLDDPADTPLPDFERRAEELDAKLQAVKGRAKKRKSSLNRLRYHVRLIGEGTGGEHDWRKVAGAIDELVAEGMAPSAVEIREIMLPILDGLPDLQDLPHGFRLVLREIDRYLAGRTPAADMIASDSPTAEVSEAARLLKGKGVVLIGGNRRPDAYEALKSALVLKELIWIETREHESIDRFEPYIARPDIALVLLAIRWSSHSFGDVKHICDRHGKPMVRLPGGYGVNQVAAQIIAQGSGQLQGE